MSSEVRSTNIGLVLRTLASRSLATAERAKSFIRAKPVISTVIILGIWLTVVIYTATEHEYWRDEVRPLSLVRAASSPLDLYHLIRNEGHPLLWYLILYVGKTVVDTPLILPFLSILIAFTAVATFLIFSPFPFLIRCLFIFSALPMYLYSVMARNYGISMMLLFAAASLYRAREKHPFLLAFILALLANTNVHSAIFTCLIAALWAWDVNTERKTTSVELRLVDRYLPFIVVSLGILLCVVVTLPSENTIVTPIHRSFSVVEFMRSCILAATHPGKVFPDIMAYRLPFFVTDLLIYFAVIGLIGRPTLFLAAFGGQVALGVFFQIVYPGGYRHQGLFLVFLLFLYWLFIDSAIVNTIGRVRRLMFHAGLYIAMLIMILGNAVATPLAIETDISTAKSSSKAFGKFLNSSAILRDAIIIPEPDYLIESLPYYASNMIYLPREHRFGTYVSFTTDADYNLSLGEILSLANDIKTRSGRPVLVVLGHWEIDYQDSGVKNYSYNKVFTWNASEILNFAQSTELIAKFNSSGDENYMVFAVTGR